MARYIIYPYKIGSASARALKGALETLTGIRTLLVHPDRNYHPRAGDRIIGWGMSTLPNWLRDGVEILNYPAHVAQAANKLNCFRQLTARGVPTVPFTTDRHEAADWVLEDGHTVMARHKLTGHSGEGVEVVTLATPVMPQVPLYTKRVENHGEYRVHVFRGEVIDYRKKVRAQGDEPTEAQSLVRTHGNGWIYAMGVDRLARVEDLAIRAIQALDLDFGAVDIIRDEAGRLYVLEVNTACGLEGTTLENYARVITEHYG